MDALLLLSGDAQNFVAKIWASHVHLHHDDAAGLVALLSLDDVDRLLTSTALRTPALRMAKDGKVLPASSFTRSASLAGQPLAGLVDPRKVLDLVDTGASVVLQGLHRYWPPLTDLVRSLEMALGHPCQANAYLTPPGSQGFAVHSDTHDVFVFQTHGRKQWEVHDGSGAARHVLLEPGVVMYLPAGTPHAARAQEAASLHVTVGINQVTWRSLLTEVAEDLLQSPQYDGRLPAGYLQDPTALTAGVRERLQNLAGALADQDPTVVASGTSHRFLSRRTSVLRGAVADRLQLSALHDDSVLSRRESTPCVLVPQGDRLRILLGDRELVVPARLADPMRFVAAQRTLRPADLAEWLDLDSRAVLARRLVREGLLRIGT